MRLAGRSTFSDRVLQQGCALRAAQGRALPAYVQREFEDFLKCGRLEHGFLRVRCERCHDEKLVAFSCRRRGLLRASCPSPFGPRLRRFKIASGDFVCPSCGAGRMAESAALLVDEVLREQPRRQWVLSVPYAIRFLFAARPGVATSPSSRATTRPWTTWWPLHYLPSCGGAASGPEGFHAADTCPCGKDVDDDRLAKAGGFSLHCGVAAAAHQRDRRERLCRYIARPAIANERLARTRVERSHLTDQQEFYQLLSSTGDRNLTRHLAEWEAFHNYHRPNTALNGKTPYEVLKKKLAA